MRIMKTATTALAISGLVLGATTAQAAAPVRSSSSVADSEELAGTGVGLIIALAVAIGIALVISDDNNKDYPTSP